MSQEGLIQRAVVGYRQSNAHKWVTCLAASRIVGNYQRGGALDLAARIGVTVSQVENYARAGVAYRSLMRLVSRPDLHKCRERVPISHFTAFADLWHRLEFDPREGFGVMLEVAGEDKIIPVAEFRNLLLGMFGDGGRMSWESHLQEAKSKLTKLVGDYGVPDGVRERANNFLREAEGGDPYILVLEGARPLSWNMLWAGAHWSERSRMATEWKQRVRAALDPDAPTPDIPVRCEITAYFADHPQDADNILVKPIIDGLKGWVIPDDTGDCIKSVQVQAEMDKANPRIVIKLVPVAGAKPWTGGVVASDESEMTYEEV